MSVDMRLLTVSDETAGSDGSVSKAVSLSNPLGSNGATGPAKAAAYVTPHSGGPSCRLHVAACSPVAAEVAGRGADPTIGAGRLLAGSDEATVLASWLSWACPRADSMNVGVSLAPPAGMMLRPPTGTSSLFFLLSSAILSCLSLVKPEK